MNPFLRETLRYNQASTSLNNNGQTNIALPDNFYNYIDQQTSGIKDVQLASQVKSRMIIAGLMSQKSGATLISSLNDLKGYQKAINNSEFKSYDGVFRRMMDSGKNAADSLSLGLLYNIKANAELYPSFERDLYYKQRAIEDVREFYQTNENAYSGYQQNLVTKLSSWLTREKHMDDIILNYESMIESYENKIASRAAGDVSVKSGKIFEGVGGIIGSMIGLVKSGHENLSFPIKNTELYTTGESENFGAETLKSVIGYNGFKMISAPFVGLHYKNMIDAGAENNIDTYKVALTAGMLDLAVEFASDVIIGGAVSKAGKIGKGALSSSKGVVSGITSKLAQKISGKIGQKITSGTILKTMSNKAVGNMLVKQIAALSKETVVSGLQEGLTEAAQEVIGVSAELIGREMAINSGNLSVYDYEPQLLKRMGESFITAFLGTAVLGMGTGGISISVNNGIKAAKKSIGSTIDGGLSVKDSGYIVSNQSENIKIKKDQVAGKPLEIGKYKDGNSIGKEYSISIANKIGENIAEFKFAYLNDDSIRIIEHNYKFGDQNRTKTLEDFGEAIYKNFDSVREISGTTSIFTEDIDKQISQDLLGIQEAKQSSRRENITQDVNRISERMNEINNQLQDETISEEKRTELEDNFSGLQSQYEKLTDERLKLTSDSPADPTTYRGAISPFTTPEVKEVYKSGAIKAAETYGENIYNAPIASYMNQTNKGKKISSNSYKSALRSTDNAFNSLRLKNKNEFLRSIIEAEGFSKGKVVSDSIVKKQIKEAQKTGKISDELATYLGSFYATGYFDTIDINEFGFSKASIAKIKKAATNNILGILDNGSFIPKDVLKKYSKNKKIAPYVEAWNVITQNMKENMDVYRDAARGAIELNEFKTNLKRAGIELTGVNEAQMAFEYARYDLGKGAEFEGKIGSDFFKLEEGTIEALKEKHEITIDNETVESISKRLSKASRRMNKIKREFDINTQKQKLATEKKNKAELKTERSELSKEFNSLKDLTINLRTMSKQSNKILRKVKSNVDPATIAEIAEAYTELHKFFTNHTDRKAALLFKETIDTDIQDIRGSFDKVLSENNLDLVISDKSWNELKNNPDGKGLSLKAVREFGLQKNILEQIGINQRRIIASFSKQAANEFRGKLTTELSKKTKRVDENSVVKKTFMENIKKVGRKVDAVFDAPWFLIEKLEGKVGGALYEYLIEKPMDFMGKSKQSMRQQTNEAVSFMKEKKLLNKDGSYNRTANKCKHDFKPATFSADTMINWAVDNQFLKDGIKVEEAMLKLEGKDNLSASDMVDLMKEQKLLNNNRSVDAIKNQLNRNLRDFTNSELMYIYAAQFNEGSFKAVKEKFDIEAPGVLDNIINYCENNPDFSDFKQAAKLILKQQNNNFLRLSDAVYKATGRKMIYEPNHIRIIRAEAGKEYREFSQLADSMLRDGAAEYGFTKDRMDGARGDIYIPDLINDWFYTTQLGEYMIEATDWMKETADLMNDADIKSQLNSVFGESQTKAINEYLKQVFNPGSISSDNMAHPGIQKLLQNFQTSVLGGAVHIMLRQPLSFSYFATEASPMSVAKSIKEFSTKGTKLLEEIQNKAPFMADVDFASYVDDIVYYFATGKRITKGKVLLDSSRKLGLKGIKVFDAVTKTIGWYSVYLDRLGKTGSETLAVREANRVVQQTQPVSNAAATSSIQRTEMMKMVLLFSRQMFQNYTNIRKSGWLLNNRDAVNKAYKRAFLNLTAVTASTSLYLMMANRNIPTDEEELKELIWLTSTANIPIVGRAAQSWGKGYSSSPPVVSAVDSAYIAYKDMKNAIDEKFEGDASWKATKSMLAALGFATGLPRAIITKPGDGVKNMMETDDPAQLFYTVLLGGKVDFKE